jgi:hypothetical protein
VSAGEDGDFLVAAVQ